MVTSDPHDSQKSFVKWALHGIELPSPKPYILTLPHCPFGEVSESWDAASWAAVLSLPQIKLNSQLSSCTSFFSQQLWQLMKQSRVDLLPATGLHKKLELWYQQWPLVPICLLRECRWIWVSLSWFSNLLYCWDWVLFGSEAGYLPPYSRKDTRWGPSETSRAYPFMV